MVTKNVLLAGLALLAAPTSALARDGTAYIGLEAGVIKPKKIDFDYQLRSLQVDDGLTFEHQSGLDVDFIAGYDFGMIRFEGELGYKRALLEDVAVNPALFTPTARPAIEGDTRVRSAMANLLLDFGSDDGLQVYAGGGLGGARTEVKGRITGPGVPLGSGIFGSDRALAWQLLAGVRLPISYNVDVGLKYRYFNTKMEFSENNNGLAEESVDGRFRSHSILASLILNIGSPPAPVPVVEAPLPPPPPPPPPATQTCPDGSVILASDACPVPPPPPPPPPPAPERG